MTVSTKRTRRPLQFLAGAIAVPLAAMLVASCGSTTQPNTEQSSSTPETVANSSASAPETVASMPSTEQTPSAASPSSPSEGSSGTPSEGGDAVTSTAAIPTEVIPKQPIDTKIQAMVPEKFRKAGSVRVATSADYPPNEFQNEGKLVGVHPDLGKALGEVMGLDFKFTITPFDSIIPGLQADRYDVAMSSASITKERMEVVDFVNDIHGADALLVRADDTHKFAKASDMCGTLMGVASGTYEAGVAADQSKSCTGDGKKAIDIKTYPSQLEAVLALSGGRVNVVIAAGSALGYIAKGEPGKFKVAGQSIFPKGTNGIELAKDNGLGPAVTAALNLLIENGTYGQILKKWGVESYAITKAEFNPTPAK